MVLLGSLLLELGHLSLQFLDSIYENFLIGIVSTTKLADSLIFIFKFLMFELHLSQLSLQSMGGLPFFFS